MELTPAPSYRGTVFARGSLTVRMIALAAGWIIPLLVVGGFALDDVLANAIRRNFDEQLNYAATALIATAEVGPNGEARSSRPLSDQRFLEPYSGLYWQVSVAGAEPFRSRSLWDRALAWKERDDCRAGCFYDSETFRDEPLRVVERDAVLPGAKTVFHFQVAQSSRELDAQVAALRSTLWWSLSLLGIGLLLLAGVQSTYGLWPLRKVSRAIAAIRSGAATRVTERFPPEINPLVVEINELLDDNATQAAAAKLHAGNLAHDHVVADIQPGDDLELFERIDKTQLRAQGILQHACLGRAGRGGEFRQSHAHAWPSLRCFAVFPARSLALVLARFFVFFAVLTRLLAPASDNAMAIACLRFFTLPPFPFGPLFNSPCLYSCMTRPVVFFCAFDSVAIRTPFLKKRTPPRLR